MVGPHGSRLTFPFPLRIDEMQRRSCPDRNGDVHGVRAANGTALSLQQSPAEPVKLPFAEVAEETSSKARELV